MMICEVVDLFCGAGGTSEGAERALTRLGYDPRITAINHWDVAVATHRLNHPNMVNLCEAIDNLNPRRMYGDIRLDLLWGSPECTNHSRAKGGKPKNEQSRATAHCVTRWADALKPKTVLVENVPEFDEWGPLDENGDPLPGRKGETYQAWLNMLRALGYTVETRVLCAADYGDPTIRERLFIQAQAPGRRIIWPEPTHSKLGDDGLLPWRVAREIINWEHPMETAFARKSKGGKPLLHNTMRRIARGLVEYCVVPLLQSGQLNEFIVPQHGGGRPRGLDEPLGTLTTTSRGVGFASAYLIPQQSGHVVRSLDKPLPTVTANSTGEGYAEAFLVQVNFGNDARPNRVKSLDNPVNTVTGTVTQGIAEAFLVEVNHGDSGGSRCKPLDVPLGTVTGKNGRGLAIPELQSYLVQIDHTGKKNKYSGVRSMDAPLSTVVTKQNMAVAQPVLQRYLVHLRGDSKKPSGIRTLEEPLPTITAQGGHIALCEVVEVSQAVDHFRVRIGALELCFGVNFRMLQPDELQLAQGFPADYRFTGNKTEQVRQIGNAVPCGLADALVYAAMNQ